MDISLISPNYTLSGNGSDNTQEKIIQVLQDIRGILPEKERQKVDSILDDISEAIIKEKVKREKANVEGWIDNNSWVVWVLGAYLAYRFLLK